MQPGDEVRVKTSDYFDGLCGVVTKVFLDLNGTVGRVLVEITDAASYHTDGTWLFDSSEVEYR